MAVTWIPGPGPINGSDTGISNAASDNFNVQIPIQKRDNKYNY